MPRALAIATTLGVLLVARVARAEDEGMSPRDRRAFSALAAGVAAAALPLVVGGVRQAEAIPSVHDVGALKRKNVGWIVAAGGLSLAPIASHLAVRSYDRAALFGAIPAAATVGLGLEVAANPRAFYDGNTGSRTLFAVLFTTVAATSAIGVIDAIHPLWGDETRSGVALHVGPGRLAVEGTF